ncbi:MAG: septal ring lytic transglycosylase RlpA family protein [Cyanobacteria bacterium J06598_1]
MDLAPSLPPSQEAFPVLVSDAASGAAGLPEENPLEMSAILDEPTVQLSFLPAPSTQTSLLRPSLLQTVGVSSRFGARPLPPALMVSVANVGKESSMAAGFLSPVSMVRSFGFVGQAWRSAHLGHTVRALTGKPLYSATVPIRWTADKQWEGKALAADIRVKRINATAQVAQIENNVWSAALIDQCMPNADRRLQDGVRYRVSIGDKTLGYVADEKRAYLLAQQLKRLVSQASFDPSAIAAYPITEDTPIQNATGYVGTPGQPMFSVEDSMSQSVGYSPDWAALSWANNLRLALGVAPLKTDEALMGLNNLEDSKIEMAGEASWYGPYFHGRATANGETYNQNDLTVAHKSLPFGTQLRVRNTLNDKAVVVRVNDRGPYVGDRILDLSKAAADCLDSDDIGIIPVEVTVLKNIKLTADD